MASQKIKQWVTSQDGLDNLNFTSADMPVPEDGEVLVKIDAVSLNYRDTEGIWLKLAVQIISAEAMSKLSWALTATTNLFLSPRPLSHARICVVGLSPQIPTAGKKGRG